MTIKAGRYLALLDASKVERWRHAKGEPDGIDEIVLHAHEDGSYTHLLRIRKGVEIPEPVKHEFHEDAFYIEGEMLNTKTKELIKGGSYVYHDPREEHGPFRCVKTCLILEFRYYK